MGILINFTMKKTLILNIDKMNLNKIALQKMYITTSTLINKKANNIYFFLRYFKTDYCRNGEEGERVAIQQDDRRSLLHYFLRFCG